MRSKKEKCLVVALSLLLVSTVLWSLQSFLIVSGQQNVDVAVVDITNVDGTTVYICGNMSDAKMCPVVPINVTVSRLDTGDPASVYVDVALYRRNIKTNENTTISAKVIILTQGSTVIVSFSWNETKATLSPGKYQIWTYAYVSGNDINLTNNALYNGVVEVIQVKEDIVGDCDVGALDGIVFCEAYGSSPGSPRWNPYCDLMPDNIIDDFDALMIARVFPWVAPNPLVITPVTWTLNIAPNPNVNFNVTIFSDYIVYSDYSFNKTLKQLNFNVTSWIDAFCNVTIPRDLMSGAFTVYLDDVPAPSIITWNETAYFIYFNSTQLSHKVKIVSEFDLEIPGDLNHDWVIDIFDAIILSEHFGESSNP